MRLFANRPALLLFVACLVYMPSFFCGFIWDDDLHVTNNIITGPGGLAKSWLSKDQPNYWPVTWTFFWAEWRLGGGHPAIFHAANVLLHAATVLVLYRSLLILKPELAFGSALLFCLHPVNVESVTWITQQKTLLSGLFCMVSLYLYLLWIRTPRWTLYWGSLASFAVSLLAKSATVPFPVALLVVLLAWAKVPVGAIVRQLTPFFVLAAAQSLTEIYFQTFQSIGDYSIRNDSMLSRLAVSGWAYWHYIYKAIIPINLCFVYPKWKVDAHNILHWIPTAGLGVILLGCLIAWRHDRRLVPTCIFWYGLFLLPVAGFINVFFFRYAFTADHYQYLSLMAGSVLLAAGWRRLASHLGRAGRISGVSLVCLLGLLTCLRQFAYLDPVVLWRDTINTNPTSALAYASLGRELSLNPRSRLEAAKLLQMAIQYDPNSHEAYNNLGNLRLIEGRTTDSIALFSKASHLMPRMIQPRRNLAVALDAAGRHQEALTALNMALEQEPQNYSTYQALIAVHSAAGETSAAIRLVQHGLSLFPGDQWMLKKKAQLSDGITTSGKPR
jgi:protein O-mannosyl-transferase